MADRTLGIENMAVSSDPSASQHNLRDNGKDENDLRGTQSNPKMEAPKKRTTFKITSVTKSSQRGGSGDLTQDNDMDSQDDLDETVDSHTEDLSSEIYDTSSKATDIDNQDPLLTPEEVMIKEKPGRFKVVKIETKEPFRRGRWICYDYLDAPERVEIKQDEIPVNSGSSSAANSVHYVHGVDDPSKNPLLAGATGTLSSQLQAISVPDGITSVKTQIEMFQPIQPAPSSQPGVTPVSQVNPSFSNHIAQSSTPYIVQAGVPDHLIGHSLPASNNPSLKSGGSIPNLPPSQHSQNQASLSSSGNIPCSSQQLPTQQGSTIPPGVHSQSASVACSVTVSQQTPPGAMQTGDYVNSASQVGACQNQHIPASHPQQGIYDMSSQQSAYSLNAGTAGSACGMGNNISNRIPQQNHLSTPAVAQLLDGHGGPDIDAQPSHSSSIVAVNSERGEEATANLGLLPPLEIAVGGISSGPTDDDITEEAGSSTVAIDNKIEQAMDLVKSHLMYAVREEVEVLKEQIKELMERMRTIEYENKVLRSDASPETLAKLPPPLPPLQNPLLQQFMSVQQPPSSSS